MQPAVTRADSTARNRTALLEAAREVFLENGFQRATLEAIARRAGFSKGLVYSQFDSKADLFLALLEVRQQEREKLHREAALHLAGPEGLLQLVNLWDRDKGRDAPWHRLVIEFRLQAASDPALNARYAELHERTIRGVADTLVLVFRNASLPVPMPPRLFAQAVLAISMGIELERAADPAAFSAEDARLLLTRLATPASQAPGGQP